MQSSLVAIILLSLTTLASCKWLNHVVVHPPVSLSKNTTMSGWGDSDNVVRFDNSTIVAFQSKGSLISTDNGWTYHPNPGGPLPGGVYWHPKHSMLQSLAVEIPKSREGYNFSSESYYVIESDAAGSLTAHEVNSSISFVGLPAEVTCKQGLPTDGCCGCPFRVSSHGSDDVVPSLDGGYLQTVNVFFVTDTKRQGPSSLVLFYSKDGLHWTFRALIANATDFWHSEEGPNESALIRLADHNTLMAIMRMDGGDGPPKRNHTTLYKSFSLDDGKTWGKAVPMSNAAILSVRPKALMLSAHGPGTGPLLLTTGRPGIFLWVNWDGMGTSWEPVNIAKYHNSLLPKDEEDQKFCPEVVNGTTYFSPYQSSVYNSLVAGNTSSSAILYYNRRSIKGYEAPDAVYAMHIDLVFE